MTEENKIDAEAKTDTDNKTECCSGDSKAKTDGPKTECCSGDSENKTECCSTDSKTTNESCCNNDKSSEGGSCNMKAGAFCPISLCKSAISIDNILKAFLKAKEVMLSPKETLASIASENKSVNEIYKEYSAPLALVAFLFQFIGMAVIGFSVPFGGTVKGPIFSGLIFTVVTIVFHLLSLFLVGKALQFISEKFSGKTDLNLCFAFAAYVITPIYFSSILSIIPALGILGLLFFVYAIYLITLASSLILEIASEKKVVFTVLTVVTFLIVNLVLGFISMAVNPTLTNLEMKQEYLEASSSVNL